MVAIDGDGARVMLVMCGASPYVLPELYILRSVVDQSHHVSLQSSTALSGYYRDSSPNVGRTNSPFASLLGLLGNAAK